LRALVAPFADPAVGAVGGELLLEGEAGSAVAGGVGLYWRIEKLMRKAESRLDSTLGVTGAIYAIRRELFEAIPPDTILDDVLIPMRIVRLGRRVVFEAGARATDLASSAGAEEFRRKVRTIAGCFQLFAREPWLLSPLHNRLWLQTVSHKLLRLLIPPLLVLALAANAALAASGDAFYQLALGVQLLFYAAALAGRHAGAAPPWLRRPLGAAYVVCLLAWATVVAFCRFASGRQAATWERATTGEACSAG
jgi:cellulose synthase/poly-beta-1,6-N-acetylglucosamine synthase-like glycosyltransferase